MICPYCNYLLDKYETLEGETKFKEGDISFCVNCGEAGKFMKEWIEKIDIDDLDEVTRKQVDDLRVAWLQTKNLVKHSKKNVRAKEEQP